MKFAPWLLEKSPEEEFISSGIAIRLGRGHPVYDFGFDSTFFEDLMRRSPLLRILNLPGGTVYHRNRSRVQHSVEDFVSSHFKSKLGKTSIIISVDSRSALASDLSRIKSFISCEKSTSMSQRS